MIPAVLHRAGVIVKQWLQKTADKALQKTGGLPGDRSERVISPKAQREPAVKILVLTGGET